jgi:hypothetical protein
MCGRGALGPGLMFGADHGLVVSQLHDDVHLEADLQPSTGWTGLLEAYESLVGALVEAASAATRAHNAGAGARYASCECIPSAPFQPWRQACITLVHALAGPSRRRPRNAAADRPVSRA